MPRPLESEEARWGRVQAAISVLCKLWIALSQRSVCQGRAKLAGKVKRTILAMEGDVRQPEVKFATGTVRSGWQATRSLCSATAEEPKEAERAGDGWMDGWIDGWMDVPFKAKAMKRTF